MRHVHIPVLLLAAALLQCSHKPPIPASAEHLAREQLGRLGSGSSAGGRSGACARPPLEIFLQAADKLNPNPKGQPMPVEVRVLLLRARERFDQLDFETLWQRQEEALEGDLVASASVTVFPGKLKIYPMKSLPDVAYVALVAVFRRPQARNWQYVIDVFEQNQRCAAKEALHTIVHAHLHNSTIERPDPDAVNPVGAP